MPCPAPPVSSTTIPFPKLALSKPKVCACELIEILPPAVATCTASPPKVETLLPAAKVSVALPPTVSVWIASEPVAPLTTPPAFVRLTVAAPVPPEVKMPAPAVPVTVSAPMVMDWAPEPFVIAEMPFLPLMLLCTSPAPNWSTEFTVTVPPTLSPVAGPVTLLATSVTSVN